MPRIEITTRGLERLRKLEDISELGEQQFAEHTILSALEADVVIEANGFVKAVLPDSLEAEGNLALNKLAREGSLKLSPTFTSENPKPSGMFINTNGSSGQLVNTGIEFNGGIGT